MKTIMVQMSDKQWTMEAMHLACALARNTQGKVVLLRLSLTNNPCSLGWGTASVNANAKDILQVNAYATIAEDYGVEFAVQPMQCISIIQALIQVCGQMDVATLFAHIPNSNIPLWRRFRLWSLKRHLGKCSLYTLEEKQPFEESIASTANYMKPMTH